MKISVTSLFFCLVLISCSEEKVEFSANNCKKMPPFFQALGFDPKYSYFSTSSLQTMGLVLQQSDQPGNPEVNISKSFQHPSWRQGGWLAPIIFDTRGNLYTAPAPFISVLDNPVSNQNTIYRIDANTGAMNVFLKLPQADTSGIQNPFGIIGMILLCETNTMYVSSIAGSDRQHERGAIYAIDIEEKKIIDKIAATDAMGMGISYASGKRQLFYGTGRSSDVNAITIGKDGKFKGQPAVVFSLAGLGPGGDDKVRRIVSDNDGNLQVHGISFDYNLKPQREKKETVYHFNWNRDEKKWLMQ